MPSLNSLSLSKFLRPTRPASNLSLTPDEITQASNWDLKRLKSCQDLMQLGISKDQILRASTWDIARWRGNKDLLRAGISPEKILSASAWDLSRLRDNRDLLSTQPSEPAPPAPPAPAAMPEPPMPLTLGGALRAHSGATCRDAETHLETFNIVILNNQQKLAELSADVAPQGWSYQKFAAEGAMIKVSFTRPQAASACKVPPKFTELSVATTDQREAFVETNRTMAADGWSYKTYAPTGAMLKLTFERRVSPSEALGEAQEETLSRIISDNRVVFAKTSADMAKQGWSTAGFENDGAMLKLNFTRETFVYPATNSIGTQTDDTMPTSAPQPLELEANESLLRRAS